MKRLSRYAEYVPVFLLILGFALVAAGWNLSAGIDYIQGQIPYVISGGLLGLGFVFFGSAALVVQVIQKGQAKQLEELHALSQATQRVASLLTFAANGDKTNGHGGYEQGSTELVVAGVSSFHLSECRLVEKRQAVIMIPREEAMSSGLGACRICKP